MPSTAKRAYDATALPLVAGRTPLLPVETITAVLESDDCLGALRTLLNRQPVVRQALYVASPSLSDAIDDWLRGAPLKNARAPIKALAYAVRMAFRCTPFGICAGIGLAEAGQDETTLQLETEGRLTQTRPDMGLLLTTGRSLEHSDKRDQVRYVTNRAVLTCGDRLYVANLELVTASDMQAGTRTEQRPVSLRNTLAVQYVREIATEAQSFATIVSRLATRFEAPSDESERFVKRLIEAGILISELRASPIGDPVSYMLHCFERIDEKAAATLQDALSLSAQLDRKPLLERHIEDYRSVHAAFAKLADDRVECATQVDLHAPLVGTLGSNVLCDAALMAEYWMRMGAVATMAKFRQRFIERYEGSDRLVPLLELVDPNVGLGLPDDFEAQEDRGRVEREATLATIACDALRRGAPEIELSGKDLDTLLPPLRDTSELNSAEVGFHVVASSRDAIGRGDYLVTPAAFPCSDGAARSLGRFASLIGDKGVQRIRDLARATGDRADLLAEFVFAPAESRSYNVVIRPQTTDVEIRLGIGGPGVDDEITPDDLWVGIANDKFYLWSARRNRRVIPTESHLFATDRFAPNVCRFLATVANDGKRMMRGFEWGPLSRLTYLPRVRIGRVALCLRRWIFQLEEPPESIDTAAALLDELRSRWQLPRYVLLADGDNRLLIDFDSKITPELLLDQTFRAGRAVRLVEALPSPEHAWLTGHDGHYCSEFIASLLPIRQRSNGVAPQLRSGTPNVDATTPISCRRRYGLGSQWAYLKLYMSAQAIDYFLIESVMPLIRNLQQSEAIDRWFFVRYADPTSHLRLRVRAVRESIPSVCERLVVAASRWLDDNLILRYAFDTYDPEYERYGGIDGLELAEQFFMLDSDLCADIISRVSDTTDERVAAAAESFVAWLAAAAPAAAVLETFAQATRQPLPEADRKTLKRLNALEITPGDDDLLKGMLARPGHQSQIAALFHLHCNRLGLSGAGESRATALIRSLFLGRAARSANGSADAVVVHR